MSDMDNKLKNLLEMIEDLRGMILAKDRRIKQLREQNAELLAAMKETSATLRAAEAKTATGLLHFAVDRGNQLIVIRDLDAAIAKATESDGER